MKKDATTRASKGGKGNHMAPSWGGDKGGGEKESARKKKVGKEKFVKADAERQNRDELKQERGGGVCPGKKKKKHHPHTQGKYGSGQKGA